MKLQVLQILLVMKLNMVGKLALVFLASILERTKQVKMLLQTMFKESIHSPSMLITW